jgi:hypothetical protein
MQHLGSKYHINDYVTPRYYNIFLVSRRCHIKEVRVYQLPHHPNKPAHVLISTSPERRTRTITKEAKANSVSGGRDYTVLGSSTFPPRNRMPCIVNPFAPEQPLNVISTETQREGEDQVLLSGPPRVKERRLSGACVRDGPAHEHNPRSGSGLLLPWTRERKLRRRWRQTFWNVSLAAFLSVRGFRVG